MKEYGMAITHDPAKGIFSIDTDNSTYQMRVDKYGYLIHLYYGRRTSGQMDYILLFADRGLSGNPYDAGDDRTYSLDYLPQEFPVEGTGDFRSPCLSIRDKSGAFGIDLRYAGFEIKKGKYGLSGLPAVYAEADEDDAESLYITLKNDRTGLQVVLIYGVLPHLDIITRSAIVTNKGNEVLTVEKLETACLDFLYGDFDLIDFYGRHTMERHMERHALMHGSHVIGSRRGYSSHEYNPLMIVADRGATEAAGRCWAMQFVYSGGFKAEAEVDQYKQIRVQMGLSDEKFSYPLVPNKTLTAPEVILSYSSEGLTKLSHNLHRCINEHICRGGFRDEAKPIVFNSWEASFFDFSGESLLALAKQAKDLGADMLVVDDGWFGDRCDDNRALGDWTPNEKKLGMSLGELIEKVNEIGVKFGIWFEPEMISEDSELYREHPDWAMAIPGDKPVRGRNQLVLDFSRKEIVDYMYDRMCEVLDQGNIEYVKWDCNRSISDVYSHASDTQGNVLYDYMIGLYDLMERLIKKYPDVLFEGCSGGGGRFDAGMLYYTPQIWCSDNTDAMDRLLIHYGTSFGYPMSTVAAHVSACPNQQTGRVTPMDTRFLAAMTGAFGYELDPAELSDEDRAAIRRQVAAYKKYEQLARRGLYYRLSDPDTENCCSWEFVSEDGSEALLCSALRENHGNEHAHYVVPRGLTPGADYYMTAVIPAAEAESSDGKAVIPAAEAGSSDDNAEMPSGESIDRKAAMPADQLSPGKEPDRIYSADALMEAGFPLPIAKADGEGYMYHLKRKVVK